MTAHHRRGDLDATAACPPAERCENCGAREHLAVATADTEVGVYCLTLCAACADAGEDPEAGDRGRALSGGCWSTAGTWGSTPTRWPPSSTRTGPDEPP